MLADFFIHNFAILCKSNELIDRCDRQHAKSHDERLMNSALTDGAPCKKGTLAVEVSSPSKQVHLPY